jgi:Protein of unknown function (DUF2726)
MDKFDVMLQELIQNQPFIMTTLLFGAIMLGVFGERMRAKSVRREWRKQGGKWRRNYKQRGQAHLSVIPSETAPLPFDPFDHLRNVMAAKFQPQRLLNKSEARLFVAIEQVLKDLNTDWRIMAQVSLGEILKSNNKNAYLAINSKRVDLLLINGQNMPMHAIEYQGGGHYQGTAAVRDAVKKEALRKAGVGYIEIHSGDTPSELRATLSKIMDRQRQTT